jgi:hypothetical protein
MDLARKYSGRELPPMDKKPPIPVITTADGSVPIIIYLNGNPLQLSRMEALDVIAQIVNTFMYLECKHPVSPEQPK